MYSSTVGKKESDNVGNIDIFTNKTIINQNTYTAKIIHWFVLIKVFQSKYSIRIYAIIYNHSLTLKYFY